MFRSETIAFCDVYLHADEAFECISRLGDLGILQFKDLNSNVNVFQRHHVNEIRHLEGAERILRYFEVELLKGGVKGEDSCVNIEPPSPKHIGILEQHLEMLEKELRELSENMEQLEQNHLELLELSSVLDITQSFLQQLSVGLEPVADTNPLSAERPILRYTAGVIPTARVFGFSRLIYFATRGTAYLRYADAPQMLKDPFTGLVVQKSVFMAVCYGEEIHSRVRKIAQGYEAKMYPCPESESERHQVRMGVNQRIHDLQIVLEKSREQLGRSLSNVGQHMGTWRWKIGRLKACFLAMDMLRWEGNSCIGQCWVPVAELGRVQAVLNVNSEHPGNIINPVASDTLPTFYQTNQFTGAFQAIIDAYGVASYKEANPALFSIITFPFLFSVMFGDAGHGLLMLLFSLFLCLNQSSLRTKAANNEIFGILFSGRYLVLLMSLFSIYAGLLYNDVFSKPIAYTPSRWNIIYDDAYIHNHQMLSLDPSNKTVFDHQYNFGVDPVWKISTNDISFTNSFKKKISIIFGVTHMLLGVVLSLTNYLYVGSALDVVFQFIPMLLFLMCLFGYLVGLIIAKWIMYYDSPLYYHCSPNLLIGFINMFMLKYDSSDKTDCSTHTWYPGQEAVEKVLLSVAIVSAVVLLCGKPLFIFCARRSQTTNQGHERLVEEGEGESRSNVGNRKNGIGNSQHKGQTHEQPGDSQIDFGEVMTLQAIHTIEFCLGCISHTASYLRLWALSLAHSQLSEVLWTMVLRNDVGFLSGRVIGGLIVFLRFVPFAVLTVVILCIMEGLSAFLHTLRLHWVEFNSKFYHGAGFKFQPFSFNNLNSPTT